ncbi:MAG: hypothetical protein JWM74_754 [Myxococcaceae bacterium]|nr:hypothetical protein [Myxococcaceae bacterium]
MLVTTGCSYDCTEEARSGVGIHVVRASDGSDVCDADVVLRDGKWEEHLATVPGGPCVYVGAYERPGTYRIEVTHASYIPAVVEGVVVTQARCHVISEGVTVPLESKR